MDKTTLSEALKTVFGSSNAPTSSSLIPYTDASRNPSGFASMANLASVLGGQQAMTFAKLGITTPCTMRDIVDAIPYGMNVCLSITPAQVTDGKDGELFIFKASTQNTIHKTHIVVRSTSQSQTTLEGFLYFGYIRYDSSLPCQWYTATITAI